MRSSLCTIGFQGKNRWDADPVIEVPIDECLRRVKAWGFEGAEIWYRHVWKHSPEGLNQVRAQLDALGLGAPMISSYYDFTTSDESCEKSVLHAREVLATARRLKIPNIRIFSGPKGSKDVDEAGWNRAAKALQILCDEANPIGLCLETHPRNLMDTVEGTQRILNMVARKNLGLILQPSTFMPDEIAAVRTLAPYARHIHATNSVLGADGRRVAAGLGEGDMDWKQIIQMLDQAGFKGFVSLEWMAEDLEKAGREAAAFLKAHCPR